MTIYYNVYLQQYSEHVDLLGFKETNQKQEKIFSCLDQALNPGPCGPVSSALSSQPSLLTWLLDSFVNNFPWF